LSAVARGFRQDHPSAVERSRPRQVLSIPWSAHVAAGSRSKISGRQSRSPSAQGVAQYPGQPAL